MEREVYVSCKILKSWLTCTSLGDDVAVPAFGLTNSIGCVGSLSRLMLFFSVLPCVSVNLDSSLSYFLDFIILLFA